MNSEGYSIFNHAQGAPHRSRDIKPEQLPEPEPAAEPAPAPTKRKKRERGWAVEVGLGLFERKSLK